MKRDVTGEKKTLEIIRKEAERAKEMIKNGEAKKAIEEVVVFLAAKKRMKEAEENLFKTIKEMGF